MWQAREGVSTNHPLVNREIHQRVFFCTIQPAKFAKTNNADHVLKLFWRRKMLSDIILVGELLECFALKIKDQIYGSLKFFEVFKIQLSHLR